MATSKHPVTITDVPQGIQRFAEDVSGICINLRLDRWPEDVLRRYKGEDDHRWGVMVSLNESHLTAPWLTDFLKKLNPGDNFLASVQSAGENIYTVAGQLKEVYWIDGYRPNEDPSPCGTLAAIRPVKNDYKHGLIAGFQVWTSYVLAIARLETSAPPGSWNDQDGTRFIKLAKKYGIHPVE